ncbi:MAG: N-acetylgalactosamine-N, N-diacetylbacillosaminyl-diphospho-undecaprenol [Candidatus Parcubacteria bacterium]|jgi:glycosyltransferase involved in cell wall biosynthesis
MTTDTRSVIVYVLPSLVASGGIERQFLAQMKVIDTTKFMVHVVTLCTYAGRESLYEQLPSYVTVHELSWRGGFDIKTIWSLYQLLRRLRPAVVVSSMVTANTLVRYLRPFVGYKVIAREHNTYEDKSLRHKIRDHIGAYFSSRIVAVSKTVADFSSRQSLIPRSWFTVIYNGIDTKRVEDFLATDAEAKVAALRAEFGWRPETKIILNVARLKKHKNHRLLIDGFALYCKAYPTADVVLCIVSAGSEEANLRAYVSALGLEDRVILTGYRNDVYTFFATAKVFFLTSDIEGFPNVAIEAFAFGVPVASTLVSGIDEIVVDGQQGRLIERTPESVCATIEWFFGLSDDAWEDVSTHAKATAAQFDITRIVKEYEDLFQELIARK